MKLLLPLLLAFFLVPSICWSQFDWTFVGSDPQPTTNFTVDECGRYLTSTGSEVYQSEDQGATWTLVEAVLEYDKLWVRDGSIYKETVAEDGGTQRYNIKCDGSIQVIENEIRNEDICDKLSRLQYTSHYSSSRVGDTIFTFHHTPARDRQVASQELSSAIVRNVGKISINSSPIRPIGRYFRRAGNIGQLLVKYSSERDYYDPDRDTITIPLPLGVDQVLYSAYIHANQPDTLVTAWTKDDGSGRTRIARYITTTNEWEYQDLPFTTPVSFSKLGFRKVRLNIYPNIYIFKNEKEQSYELKHTLQAGDSVLEFPKDGDELLANAPNDQLAHYTDNGIIRFDKPKFNSTIVEIHPLVTGGLLAKNHQAGWVFFEDNNTIAQPADFSQGFIISSDTLGPFIYEQIWTSRQNVLISKSNNSIDTLFRQANYVKWQQLGSSPTSRIITLADNNYEISNGTLRPLRATLFEFPIGIQSNDTLILKPDSFSIYRSNGTTSSVTLGSYSNQISNLVYSTEDAWYLKRFFVSHQPSISSMELIRITKNTTEIDYSIFGATESDVIQTENGIYGFKSFNSSSTSGTPSSGTFFSQFDHLPTHVFGRSTTYCRMLNDQYESPTGYFEGSYTLASKNGKIFVSGAEGIYSKNRACLNPERILERHCLAPGDTLQWHGQSIYIAGIYLDTLQGLDSCNTYRLTVYEEGEVVTIRNVTTCIGDAVAYSGVTFVYDSAGLYQEVFVELDPTRNCEVTRLFNVDVTHPDTLSRDTLLPLGSSLFGEEITANGQVISGFVDIDGAGCEEYVHYTVSLTSGQVEPPLLAPIRLSPNPTNGQVIISGLAPQQGTVSIRLSDAAGRVIRRSALHDNTIDLRQHPAGVYYLNFTTAEGTSTRRVVKQ